MPTARRNNHSQQQPRRPNNAQPAPPPPPRAPVYIGGPNWPDHLRTSSNRRRHGAGGGGDNVNGGHGGGRPSATTRRQQQGEREEDVTLIADELRERFNKEPDSVILRSTGWTICLPKYNGVAWWYPENSITASTTAISQQQPHPLEAALCRMFCFVEAMQTILLFAWPARGITIHCSIRQWRIREWR